MADFYVKYGSKSAKLIAYYSCGGINIKLHIVGSSKYVLSKNRKVIYDSMDATKARAAFHNLIYMEAPDLFYT